ncbi:extracellular solute-binding protein [Paenibacillus sp. GD4]|uniref:extracellular solute-binding protein n=1 Tax=Paenibacillus sp. GD4 TaxID=3068890 RepID=UPI0027969508|nr:extracellular solute-binding protein [Paenibacillus sp. GD4]MDQ1913635.1 extracellular solute-binding protein [Paenibacillus sp. GD4]
MQRNKPWTAAISLIAVLSTMIAGCNSAQENAGKDGSSPGSSSSGTEKKPVEITVASQNKYAPNKIPNAYIEEVEKRFGMKWKYESIPLSAGMEKYNVMFASGDYPDFIPNMNSFNTVKKWAASGYLLPIGDYIDKLPNYRKLFTEEQWRLLVDFSSINGKLYTLPSINGVSDPMVWIYRKDAFDKAGIAQFPKTTEELYQALKRLKAAHPDFAGIGVRGGSGNTGIKALMSGFQNAYRLPKDLGGADGWAGFWNDPDAGNQVVFGAATQKHRDMLIYLAKLYKEGLIDKEFATLSEQQWTEKRLNGKYLIDFQWVSQVADLTEKMKSKPEVVWDYSRSHLQAGAQPGLEFRAIPVALFGPVFSSKLAKQPEKLEELLKYIDWSSTEEGQLFHMMGIENVTYEKKEGIVGYKEGFDRKRVATEYGFDWFLSKSSEALKGDKLAQKSKEAWAVYEKLPYVTPKVAPLTEEESGTVNATMSAINDVVYPFATKAVMGMLDVSKDEVWNNYLKDLDKVGLQKVGDIYKKYWK